MSTTADFLEIIAKLTDDSNAAAEYLENIINDRTQSPQTRIEMLKIQTTLNLQNIAIRQMCETQLSLEDQLHAITDKLDPS